jgi:hypothetical protein
VSPPVPVPVPPVEVVPPVPVPLSDLELHATETQIADTAASEASNEIDFMNTFLLRDETHTEPHNVLAVISFFT